ncbi:oxysterol-binding protein-related protein 11 [Galleria mellonella]|uniref:Oxysterol-binding protein-related protein 11 n=1 Tax=Galleria mellonella TaxID=7137 RepID=A0A6J3C7S9_GALME|nr:oxysterol-binding protein-related protein 11 [Galleria mellonella]
MMKTTNLGSGSHRPLSGQLYKYTNVVKGWQQRWFAVDPETGVLSYYLYDGPGDTIQPGQPARGEAHLAAAVICPSDEDSRTFTINCASGDMLKLRATDARARQEWVNGLRAIAEIHTKAMGANPPLQPREQLAVHDAMASARQQLQATELSDAALARCIESSDSPFPHTDPDLLLLKATSAANMQCLLQCLGILHRQQQYATVSVSSGKHSDTEIH